MLRRINDSEDNSGRDTYLLEVQIRRIEAKRERLFLRSAVALRPQAPRATGGSSAGNQGGTFQDGSQVVESFE